MNLVYNFPLILTKLLTALSILLQNSAVNNVVVLTASLAVQSGVFFVIDCNGERKEFARALRGCSRMAKYPTTVQTQVGQNCRVPCE